MNVWDQVIKETIKCCSFSIGQFLNNNINNNNYDHENHHHKSDNYIDNIKFK